MGRRNAEEFPQLRPLGLTTVSVLGDGNCLFNALSDQLYGHQNKHAEIRDTVIEYLRNNRSQFIHFIVVNGTRRNPKRKTTAASASTLFSFTAATDEEQNIAYEAHLRHMAQGGTYGDNIEIIAFAKAYNTDVKIFNDFAAYYVRAADDNDTEKRPIAYIARHTWEHYSSVRNIDGPFTGLPQVQEKEPSQEEMAEAEASSRNGAPIQEWMIRSVMTSLPYLMDEDLISRTLEEFNGHVDNAVSKLLESQYRNDSLPSSPGSSSVERDFDSDSDEIWGPNKRQNRRIKALKKAKGVAGEDSAVLIPSIELTQPDTSTTSLNHFTPTTLPFLSSLPPPTQLPKLSVDPRRRSSHKHITSDEDWAPSENDDYHPDGDDDDAGSIYSGSSRAPSVSFRSTPPRTKSMLKQGGPKRVTARERKESKKAAQKQARKNTKRAGAKKSGILTPLGSSPPVESVIGMKTLYI